MKTEAELRYLGLLALAELRSAGMSKSSAVRFVRLLDLDDIEVENGEVVGLDEQVKELKTEFPKLFAAPTIERVEEAGEDAEAEEFGPEAEVGMDASERQVLALLKGSNDPAAARDLVERAKRRTQPGPSATERQAALLLAPLPAPAGTEGLSGTVQGAVRVARGFGQHAEAARIIREARGSGPRDAA